MQTYLEKLLMKLLLIYKKIKNNFFIQILLGMFSYIYFLIYKTRLTLYKFNILKTTKLSKTVISIGNITSGGTGKTSLTIEIAKYLIKNNYKVAILSRGYKRKIIENKKKVVLVSDGKEILTDHEVSGDEPYLIAKKVREAIVLVGSDKVQLGMSAIKLGAEVLILDDGYQYLKLHRDENILLLDSTKPFDNGHLLPRGLLREKPDSIKRATAIVLTNSNQLLNPDILKEIKQHATEQPIISMSYKIKKIKGLNIKKEINLEEAQGLKLIAFSGIGNPDSFLNTLKQNNLSIIDHLVFPDHHNYTVHDIQKIIQEAEKHKTENIITTEKDAIKIEWLCESIPLTVWSCEIEIVWDVADPFKHLCKAVFTFSPHLSMK